MGLNWAFKELSSETQGDVLRKKEADFLMQVVEQVGAGLFYKYRIFNLTQPCSYLPYHQFKHSKILHGAHIAFKGTHTP